MRKLYHSDLVSLCSPSPDRPSREGPPARAAQAQVRAEFEGLAELNPCLLLPVYIDDNVHLWGSNMIIEYLLRTYPDRPRGEPRPFLAATMTRPDHHWQDSKVLATLETMTDSITNLRQMKMSGCEPDQVTYLRRQRERFTYVSTGSRGTQRRTASRLANSRSWMST